MEEEQENGVKEENVRYRGWKAMPYVLGNGTFEKLGTLGTSSNLLVYLTTVFNMHSVTATTVLNVWSGTANIATLFGAFLSDAYFGRYYTIAVASIASFLVGFVSDKQNPPSLFLRRHVGTDRSLALVQGMAFVTLTAALPGLDHRPCSAGGGACQEPSLWRRAFLFSGLGLMVVGAGGIRPCNLAFGADQFDPKTEAGKKGIDSFFIWYYFTFTIAMMISATFIIYVQSNVSWAVGLAIPAGLMFLSCVLFFVGTPMYVRVRPEGSSLTGLAQVAVAAFRKRRLRLPEGGAAAAALFNPVISANTLNTRLPHTDRFRFLDKAAIATSKDEIEPDGLASDPWRLCSLQQVEEVKCLLGVIPIWSTGILYFACESQQYNYTVLAALQSDRHLGKHFVIPAGSFTVFSLLAFALWIPIYTWVVVPWLRKQTGRREGMTLIQRMGVGIVLSVVGLVISAMVEVRRRRTALVYPTTGKSEHGGDISSMSGLWLVIQLAVTGISGAFNTIGQNEFYYKQFPENMRSVAGSLLFCAMAIAHYVSGFLVTVVHIYTTNSGGAGQDWLAEDLNKGKLDSYYLLIAALGVINFFYFLICARRYKYKGSVGMVGLTLTAAIPALQPPDCSTAPGAPANCDGAGPSGSLVALLIVSLGLLTVAAGGIRSCSIPFGVDQFDPTTETGQRDIGSFFNWYYFAVTIAALVALTAIVYVQNSVSWALGLGIPAALMLVSVALFFLGTRIYVYVLPEGSVFTGVVQVLVAAYRKRGLRLPSPSNKDRSGQVEMYDPPPTRFTVTKLPLTQQFRHNKLTILHSTRSTGICNFGLHIHACRFLNKAAIVEDGDLLPDGGGAANPWRLCSVQKVEELKCLIRITPVWAAGILFYLSTAQQSTLSVLQALKMDRHLGPRFQIPPGSLSIISMLSLTLFLPLYDRVLVPAAARVTGREGGITLLQRIGVGMAFSVLSVVVAALVERKRRVAALLRGGPGGVAPISVMWLAPQLVLLGVAEAFNVIGQIEFFYKQFPENMRSVAGAIGFLSFAVASYLSSAMVAVVRRHTSGGPGGHSWMEDDINLGRVDYFYYLIAAMGVVNLAYFLVCAHLYRYKGGESAGRSQDGGRAALELQPQGKP
ncbi:hypothetical protein Taro_018595 [Colocasia esculenta]|uniref:Uncharacterized protein n=1 Tax=Colocasia esculenta TaxID=4460 RepID=A0A843UJ26_COLES|nr:hypothetical protein [Colocasia esculenta]